MSETSKEWYYKFDYLLKPALPMVEAEQKALWEEFLTPKEYMDLLIDASINAFAAFGDAQYSANVGFKNIVATEKTMDATKLKFQKCKTVEELSQAIEGHLIPYPAARMAYNKLYNFEMFLLRQKKQRRAKKNLTPD